MVERDREALEDMRRSARQAVAWARQQGRNWTSDAKTVAAVAHMVAQTGEAARRVSNVAKAKHAEVPWAAIAGMRNRIHRDYGGLDATVLAETVKRDLPALARRLDEILRSR